MWKLAELGGIGLFVWIVMAMGKVFRLRSIGGYIWEVLLIAHLSLPAESLLLCTARSGR